MSDHPSVAIATPPKRRRIGAAMALVAVLVAAGGGLWYYHAMASKADEAPPAVTLQFAPSEVVRPLRVAMPQIIEFSGPLVAPRTAIVRAKSNGTLLSLAVAEGSRVKAGQLIGNMDLSELQSRIADRSAAVESAKAAMAEAERLHEANVRLADQHFIAPTALHTSQSKVDAARAQVKSAQAQLASSTIGARDAGLIAPIAGIVGKRHVVPGEKLSAEQNIVTIVDLSTLELAGNVSTHEVSLLQVGQPVQVRVEGFLQADSGRIDRIAPAAEAGTRAIGVVVVIENPAERLRAGQYADAAVTLPDGAQRLTVPVSAVTQESGQEQVWTIEKGVLVRRIVVTGRSDAAAGRVEILQGLGDDANVLAVRFDDLKEGAAAVVGSAAPAPSASASSSGSGSGAARSKS